MSRHLCACLIMCHIKRINSCGMSCDHNGWNIQAADHASPFCPILIYRNHDQSVHPVTLHNIEALSFFLQIIIRAEQNQTVTILSCLFSDIFYQLRKKRVGDVGHDHTDQAGLAPYQALRHYIWLKIMLSCTCKNTFPDLWIYCCISI